MHRYLHFIDQPVDMKICLLLLVLFFYNGSWCKAQVTNESFVTDSTQLQYLLQLYTDSVNGFNRLYNGAAYSATYPGTVGHPFFKSPVFQNGTIVSENVVYHQVPLLYDLVTGNLVTKDRQQNRIILSPDRIERFTIGNDSFLQLQQFDALHDADKGYYLVLYNGATKVFVKMFKQTERGFRAEDPNTFTQYDRYFILTGNNFIAVNSEASLFAIFSAKKNLLHNFLKSQKLRYKKAPAKTIVAAAAWYDHQKK